jgi:hypothetical protein
MSITLEAFSPVDAVAIVRSEHRLRLCRPPYRQINTIELPESAIEDAVLNHDFHASGASFASWAAVITFLNQQLIAYRESRGCPVAEPLNNIAVLDVAPLMVLQAFLEKVENELIPQRQFTHAKNFLLALLESNATQEHVNLKVKSISLLRKIQHSEDEKSNSFAVLENKYSRLGNLSEKVNRQADYVRKNGFFGSLGSTYALAL